MLTRTDSSTIVARIARIEGLARFLAVLVATTGVLVLLGWSGDDPLLKSGHPSLVAMNPATAISFILAAISLTLSTPPRSNPATRRTAGILALAVLAVATMRLIGYAGIDVGLDQVLYPERLDAEPIPNRMAPNTAVAFVLSGLALLGLAASSRMAVVATRALAILAFAVSLMTLCGYAYRSAALVGLPGYIPMALPTALGFVALSGGILCARPWIHFRNLITDEDGSRMARGLLVPSILVPFVLGYLRVRAESHGVFDAATGAAVMAVTWTAILGAALWWQARVLNRADAARTADERRIAELNRELNRRATEVEATNRELEAFSYSVSHDLRAPLRSITSFSQALLEDCAERLDDRGRDYLDRVVRAGRKMADLIEDIMVLSRITRADMQRTEVDLSATAREIAAELSEEQPLRAVEVRVQPGIVTNGDPKLLRVALANLMGNAWKFTGRVAAPRIEFGALPNENGGRVFFVRDNGAGFDMQHADRLFGPFQRLHSESEFPGTGVGLATVQRVVRRHGGRVWARSSVSRGAAFYFTVCKEGGNG